MMVSVKKQSYFGQDLGRVVKQRLKSMPVVRRSFHAINAVQDAFNSPLTRRVVEAFDNITTAVGAVVEKPSPHTIMRSTAQLCKVLVAAAEVDPSSYFDGDEWTLAYAAEFSRVIIGVLSRMPQRTYATTRPGSKIVIVELDGCKVGWLSDRSVFDRPDDHVYVEIDKLDAARESIRKALWQHYSGKSIVLRRVRSASYASSDSINYTFEQDDNELPLPSSTSDALAAYVERAMKGGVTRSMLLWGAPGTGKTSLARAMVEKLGLRCLRLRVEDVNRLQNSTLIEALNVFAPQAVIIDDLDRMYGNNEHLFEMLTTLKKRVPLVLGTCNNKKKVPAALRRPGRFDERRKIAVIDHGVVRTLLGAEFADAFDTVKDWPIVYVEEYAIRRRFQAPEELADTVRELRECMKELQEETMEQDDDSMVLALEDDDDNLCEEERT